MNKTITCGPFVGSFFEEITNFRPFVQWVSENVVYDDIFVFSHYNREYLYKENMIPIFEQYSVEYKTKFHLNKDITPKLYNIIFKNLRNSVIEISNIKIKDIVSLFNKYPKNRISISDWNKTYNKIDVPDIDLCLPDNFIVFITSKKDNKTKTNKILKHLQSKNNVIVICNNTIYNINKNYDMLDRRFEYCLNVISKARMVVCPISDWTFLCNLQGVPVMSWGDNITQYKNGGSYHFGNQNHIISNTIADNIISAIEYFRKKI